MYWLEKKNFSIYLERIYFISNHLVEWFAYFRYQFKHLQKAMKSLISTQTHFFICAENLTEAYGHVGTSAT